MTVPGQVLGTPLYLAPEQAAGEKATSRSDLYSTGVVLYEMLAGAPPFTGDTPVAIALAHQQAPVPRLTDRAAASIPPPLVATIDRALEKDPARRFPDAESMRTALTSGPPMKTAVLPVSVPPPPGRPSRARRPWVAVVAAFIAVAVLALVTFALANRDDSDSPTGPAAASTTSAPTTTTEPPTTTTGPPQTIGELISFLGANPGAFGEKETDLLGKLAEAQQDPEEAAKLIDEIDKWVSKGELDPAIGSIAQSLLAPLASSAVSDDRRSNDSGNGRGNGNGDDD
jgi:serine/threonine-protein kinase